MDARFDTVLLRAVHARATEPTEEPYFFSVLGNRRTRDFDWQRPSRPLRDRLLQPLRALGLPGSRGSRIQPTSCTYAVPRATAALSRRHAQDLAAGRHALLGTRPRTPRASRPTPARHPPPGSPPASPTVASRRSEDGVVVFRPSPPSSPGAVAFAKADTPPKSLAQ